LRYSAIAHQRHAVNAKKPSATAIAAWDEAEQDLGTGDEGAQLLKQLAVLALEPFFDVFVLGILPEPLLDHVVGGHVCSPSSVCPALYGKPGAALCPWGAWSVR
jgi:hypothetical protein